MPDLAKRFLLLAAVCLLGSAVTSADVPSPDLLAEYEKHELAYRADLDELARWCKEQGRDDDAARVADWRPQPSAGRNLYYLPPTWAVPNNAPPQNAADVVFMLRFSALKQEYAERLFALAGRAAKAKQFTLAVAWTHETLREAGIFAPAAKLLGRQLVDPAAGVWLSPFEAAKWRAGDVWHDRYGWLPSDHVARYEQGERYLNGKWVSAEEDARIHADIARGWTVDTENFRVRTNHSLEEGVRLAALLEKLHHVWRQVFARYHTAEGEWTRLFAGGEPRTIGKRRYNVVYFRNRDEYVAALEKREPKIGLTSGIYMEDDDVAYFYADPERSTDPFVYHEVTHQLFSLSKATSLKVGARANFWIVEGVACYFETLALYDDYAELGGADNDRMNAARYRLLHDKFYVSLAEFTALSRTQLQSDPRIATLYSQASGLAAFLLDAHAGRDREATVDYLHAIYGNRDTPTTLAQLTGRSYAELDQEYAEWMKSLTNAANEQRQH